MKNFDIKKIINIETGLKVLENLGSWFFSIKNKKNQQDNDKGSDRFLENSWLKEIAPSRVLSYPSYILVDKWQGDREYQTTIHFIWYPNFIYGLWLKNLLNLNSEFNLSIFVYPTNPEEKILDLENKIKKANDIKALYEMRWKEPDEKLRNLDKEIQETQFFIEKLRKREDAYIYVSIIIRYKAKDKKKLNEILKTVWNISYDMWTWTVLDEVKCRQIQGLQSTLPTWINRLKYTHPFTTYWARLLFPFYPKFEPIQNKSGFFFWVNEINNQLIFLDLEQMYTRVIENKNLVLWGTSWGWKSTLIRTFMHRNFINNPVYFVIDPKSDYTEHAKDWGWKVINFSLERWIPFNFFEVSQDYKWEYENTEDRIAKIKTLFALMVPWLFSNAAKSSVFDIVITKIYELDSTGKKIDMWKFYNVINLISEEFNKKDKRDNYLPELAALKELSLSLQPYVFGAYKNLLKFDESLYNEINNSNTNYTVFNLSKLEDAPEVKSVASFLALQYSWTVIKANKWDNQFPYVIVDEAWDLLWAEWASTSWTEAWNQVANYIVKMYRLARWYGAGVLIATQNASDLIEHPVWLKIYENSAIQVLLKNSATAADQLQKKLWEQVITNQIKKDIVKLRPWQWYLYYWGNVIKYRWFMDPSWEYRPEYEPKNRM